MAIAFVKATELRTTGNSASGTVTATASNALIAVVVCFGPALNVMSTPTGGGTWAVNYNGTASSLSMKVGLGSCPSATGGSATITTAWTGASGVTSFILEFSGLATTAGALYEGNGTDLTGTSTTPATNALSNTQATCVKIAEAVVDAGDNNAWSSTGTGWTLPTNGSEPDGVSWLIAACGYKIVSAAQSDTETWSRSGSNPWRANMGTYLDVPGSGLPPGLGPAGEMEMATQSAIASMMR